MKFASPSSRSRRQSAADPGVRLGVATLVVVMGVGVIGYHALGLSLFDAFYQTAITVTTVGFREVGPTEAIDRSYRAFTLGLVFFGVGAVLYTLGATVEGLVEGSINHKFQARREQRMVDKMTGHLIIVGAGRVGRAIAHYVVRHGAEVVVIDRRDHPDLGYPIVLGEATDDAALLRAGIDRAATLISALDSDADNVYVTLSARALNPNLYIVTRTNLQSNEAKFFQAGADRVVNPHQIGGSRMGALAMHPTLAEFLDEILHEESHNIRIAEVEIPAGTGAPDRSVSEVLGAVADAPLLLAIRDQDHAYLADPDVSTTLARGDVLIVLGSIEKISRLRASVGR